MDATMATAEEIKEIKDSATQLKFDRNFDLEVFSQEFAISMHQQLGRLFDEMASQDAPPAVVVITPIGMLLVGSKQGLVASLAVAMQSDDFKEVMAHAVKMDIMFMNILKEEEEEEEN